MPLMIGTQIAPGPKKKTLFLPRDPVITFDFIAVNNSDLFDIICPRPKPGRVWKVGEGNVSDTKDPTFLKRMDDYATAKGNWMFLKSIEPSQITWETIDMEKPDTWGNWQKELTNAGFSEHERDAIYGTFIECNMVTDAMLLEARNRFLAEQEAMKMLENLTSLPTEQDTTLSGEPAKDFESSLPK